MEISDEPRRRHAASRTQQGEGAGGCDCTCTRRHGDDALEEVSGDARLMVFKLLIERLTGHDFELFDPSDLQHHECDEVPRSEPAPAPAPRPEREWGLEFDYEEIHYESEQASFRAAGCVTTADGRKIAFEVDVAMSREYVEKKEVHLREGAATTKDPPALSLDGAPVTLTPATLSFDLDADGTAENVSFVAPGSAWLALDRNRNGAVDDGSELFGPRSGGGFADLASLDGDGNGWIDEGDAEFANLRLWERSADGEDRLRSLTEAGVGAISLARVATPFSQRGAGNDELGETRATGVYLWENGAAGVVQQVDLAI
jgi:hypothetical protein